MEPHELKILAAMLGTFAVLSSAGGIYLMNKNGNLRQELALQEEVMNSVKAKDDGTIKSLGKDLNQVKLKNDSLTVKVSEVNQLIAKRDQLLRELRSLNDRRLRKIDTIQAELSAQRSLADSIRGGFENKRASLENEIASLNDRIRTMVPRSALTADQFLVKAVKHNDKVTAKAKKVDQLEISFNIPSELQLSGNKEVYLSLTDTRGESMFQPLMDLSIGGSEATTFRPVHASKSVDFKSNTERVEFVVDTGDDVKPGIYRASIYTKDRYLGSVEFSFRDSFWFF